MSNNNQHVKGINNKSKAINNQLVTDFEVKHACFIL